MNANPYSIHQQSWRECAAACTEIRQQVFILEQAVPESDEWDGLDEHATHFVAFALNTQQPVACARLLSLPGAIHAEPQVLKLTRLAVLKSHRRQGIGRALVDAALAEARRRRYKTVVLDAQIQAQRLYSSAGFSVVGKPFIDAGIEHIKMIKQLA